MGWIHSGLEDVLVADTFGIGLSLFLSSHHAKSWSPYFSHKICIYYSLVKRLSLSVKYNIILAVALVIICDLDT
jgi:hypothetical protein